MSRVLHLALILLAFLGALGCTTAPGKPEVAHQPQGSTPDPGPKIQRTTGTRAITSLPDTTAQATNALVEGGHLYLALTPDLTAKLDAVVHIQVEGERHAVAALTQPPTTILLRFVGPEIPSTLTLTLTRQVDAWDNRVDVKEATFQTLKVNAVGKPAADKALADTFFSALGPHWQTRAGWAAPPFYGFAQNRLNSFRKDPQALAPLQEQRRADRSDISELMHLYTGMTSLEEALQQDRGLFVRQNDPQTIPIDQIQPIPLATHPWPDLIATLPGSPRPVVESMAAIVPEDVLYIHVRDLRNLVKLARDLEDLVMPISAALESRTGASFWSERVEQQLVIERTILSERFGHLVADEVAIIAGDPFVREGSDVAILFLVKDKSAIDGVLTSFEIRAKKRRPDLTASKYSLGGVDVEVLSTPDHDLEQHRFRLGDVLVLANDRAMVERLVAVRAGKARAMKEAGDFQYMRARYPYGGTGEEAFVFIGDAFVGRVVGPKLRILQARRLQAQADLLTVNHAALLFGWLEGRPAKDTGELLASGLLRKEELKHGDGEEIVLDMKRGAWSAKWGRVSGLTPLSALSVEKVSVAEQEGYRRFAEGYQYYWRQYADPVGVMIRRSEDGRRLKAEAIMLPLIEGTDYNELKRQVGIQTTPMPRGVPGASLILTVGKDARMRQELNGLASATLGDQKISFDWLGDWVMVGVADWSAFWDVALSMGQIPSLSPVETRDDIKLLSQVPVWISVHVRNDLGLALMLAGLKTLLEQVAPGVTEWVKGEPFRDVEISVIRERDGALSDGEMGGRDPVEISYALVNHVWVVSLSRAVLEQQIAVILDGPPEAEGTPPQVQSAILVEPQASNGWLVKTFLGLVEGYGEKRMRTASAEFEPLVRGLGKLPEDAEERRAVALGFLGVEPVLSHGGRFELDARGFVTHSLYGPWFMPKVLEVPVPNSPLSRAVQALESLRLGVSFEDATPKGGEPGLGLKLDAEWNRRP